MKKVCCLIVRLTSLCIIFVLVGCASLQKPVDSDRPPRFSGSLPDGSIRADTEDSQVAQLWWEAQQARQNDDNEAALEHLYKAIEITPTNSMLWSRAAEIQLDKSEAAVAENFAIKSNLYAGDNLSLLHRNWLIIEHARSLRGDLLGVRSAHKKVQEFQYR